MNGPDRQPYRQSLLAGLLAAGVSAAVEKDPNRSLLASIIAGQGSSFGCLPPGLGLEQEQYAQLTSQYFSGTTPVHWAREAIPIPEVADIVSLLVDYRANEHASELWVATILATACAGRDHLWQDLGFMGRDELSRLMWVNFPELARANTGDMKWKKFIYRQLCAREGIYVCPAPSCAECKDYAQCFGPEN